MKKYIILIIAILIAAESYAGIWQKIPGEGNIPSARYGHRITGVGSKILLTGGYGMDFKRVYSFGVRDNSWVEFSSYSGSAPSDRGGHSALMMDTDIEELEKHLFIFGGAADFKGPPVSTVTYTLKEPFLGSREWGVLTTSGTVPALAEHQAVFTNQGSTMIVFGGYYWNGASLKVSSDTYVLKLSTTVGHSWTKLDTTGVAPGLYGHQMVLDGNRIYVTGGKKQDGTLNKSVYKLNLNGKEWSKDDASADLPEGVYRHTTRLMREGIDIYLFLYGGKTDSGINEKVYSMQLNSPQRVWELVDTIGDIPTARYGHSMAIIDVGGEKNIAMFGGKDNIESFDDLYFFYFSGEEVKAITDMAEKKPYNAPNPFNPEAEKTKIVFYLETDTRPEIKIRIYTLTGYLVNTKDVTGNDGLNQVEWDGRNEAGNIVANGGYICHISGGGYSGKFKIAILR